MSGGELSPLPPREVQRRVRVATRTVLKLGIPLGALVATGMFLVYPILLGATFRGLWLAPLALAVAAVFYAVGHIGVTGLTAVSRPGLASVLEAAAIAPLPVLLIVLIRWQPVNGAALASLATYVLFAGLVWLVPRWIHAAQVVLHDNRTTAPI